MTLFLICAVVGIVAGLLAGLLGLGGGAVIVPPLIYLFTVQGFDPAIIAQLAVGTSLATIIVTSINSVRTHHRAGFVRWPVLFRLGAGIVVGALLGAAIADQLSGQMLTRLFGGFAILMALRMLWSLRRRPGAGEGQPEPGAAAGERLPATPGLTVAGGVIGTISSLFGIGGGSLTVPFLSWCRLPMQNAVAISSACGLPIAVAGSVGFIISGWDEAALPSWSLGYIYLPAALAIVITSAPMARVGARFSHRLPSATLKRVFAVVLLVVGLDLIFY